jgi:hypothetical protein
MIKPRHFGAKPILRMTASKKDHHTLSYALLMSSFIATYHVKFYSNVSYFTLMTCLHRMQCLIHCKYIIKYQTAGDICTLILRNDKRKNLFKPFYQDLKSDLVNDIT